MLPLYFESRPVESRGSFACYGWWRVGCVWVVLAENDIVGARVHRGSVVAALLWVLLQIQYPYCCFVTARHGARVCCGSIDSRRLRCVRICHNRIRI
ncbi:hypothetical protein Tsubulata_037645 [Turnera subulata]|uniref:Uncharacterized protein n=1 Tax=Turnera subulata TaxID=218843 RepID=A0A9Q0JNM0_9ROSI|nr:hypothetical protein Tsubulata_037645 [Turnera subulata]